MCNKGMPVTLRLFAYPKSKPRQIPTAKPIPSCIYTGLYKLERGTLWTPIKVPFKHKGCTMWNNVLRVDNIRPLQVWPMQ
jgi:hypothetical protein